MKIADLKLEILTVLATLAFLSTSVAAIAADYFPLDVWEEMDAWEQTITAGLDPDLARHNESMPVSAGDAQTVNASFPFDVWEELNHISGTAWSALKNWKAFELKYGTAKKDTTNPYWMPEEYRTP